MSFWEKPLGRFGRWMESGGGFVRGLSGWRRWCCAFLAGIGTALAMAPVYVLPLLALGFTTLVLLIDAAATHPRPRRSAFVAGWFFGFGYFLAGVYWMAFSFFVQADQFAWMAPFAVTGMPAFLALFPALAALVCMAFWRPGWSRILLFAVVWAVLEYVRGHILTGLPWNLAGQALAGTAVGAQTAAWYGAYGLSLVAVLLAAAPSAGLGQQSKRPWFGAPVMFAGVALVLVTGFVRLTLPEPQGDGTNLVRIVQPNIPQREKIDSDYWVRNFERQLEHSIGAIPPDANLYIIWPENGAPLLSEAQRALAMLSQQLPDRSLLIAGAVRREMNADEEMDYFNSIAIVEQTPQGRAVIDHYDKHHLVPFGEYLPFYDLLNAIGLAQLTPYGDSGFAFGSGPRVIERHGTRFAPMICYEAIFPGASYPKGDRPDWLVTVTNDAWFGDTSGPRQHLDMARLRSIEAGLPMARSANTGISALIDGKGRVLARIKLYKAGKIDAPLPPPLPPTLYSRTGDWVFWILCVALMAAVFGADRKTRSAD
ncbi:apolipoprotein N-acyltransferase [Hyphococcus flavus]|uniref:Apolipoprotein N-acyltransferase n=1 Tax=Hyphococcus flavus TaxID=1866326 RepID=A0AAF0CIA2_9PROT|nr:apolipoprotein N-acyltransferase [Hyphococcus flavus]WDI32667.1 apolipoprotein N-acyltransferase [Hyphococcus flavus]